MSGNAPRHLIAGIYRLWANHDGTVFIQYTSLALLIAIAALAYLTTADGHPLAL